MYDERSQGSGIYLISAKIMFRTRDPAPIVRDYITDRQRDYIERETRLDLKI
jgi:cyclopropane-fatty-acyl-phospholipid synthase